MTTAIIPQGISDLGRRGHELYARLRPTVETPENIGKLIVMDVVSGDYEIDDVGIDTALRLQAKHPASELYCIRIGYKAGEAIGGALDRTES